MNADRRQIARKYMTYFSQVIDNSTTRMLGYIGDITTAGAMLIGDVELPVGAFISARIYLPREVCQRPYLETTAEVVWKSPDRDPGVFRSGLKWHKLSAEDTELLDRLIYHYGLPG